MQSRVGVGVNETKVEFYGRQVSGNALKATCDVCVWPVPCIRTAHEVSFLSRNFLYAPWACKLIAYSRRRQ
jgi:hypothetical protein